MTPLLVVPATPALTASSRLAPAALDDVLIACDEVLSAVCAQDPVRIVAARDVLRDRGGGLADAAALPTGAQVAHALLDRVGQRGLRQVVVADGGPLPAADMITLFVADGSAGVGDKPPRPGPAAVPFDDALLAALGAGDWPALARITDTAAARAGCTTAAVWRSLAQVGATTHPVGTAPTRLTSAAPLGVRCIIAAWAAPA